MGVQLPFFGDVVTIIGALGFTPMDFVLPQARLMSLVSLHAA